MTPNPATMTVTRRELLTFYSVLFLLSLGMFIGGIYVGMVIERSKPTAHVEVTSKEMEGKR
jgi:hypothetical protein